MRFLLIDDHKIIREGLKQILLMHFPSSSFEESSSAEDVVSHLTTSNFDLAICDLSMPGRSGLDVLKQAKEICPAMPILILSMHPDQHYAIRALKAGAWGYINKSDGAEVLIPAIHKVLQGRKYIPAHVAEELAGSVMEKNTGRFHEQLSPREFDVFRLLAEGKSISDISQQLCLSLSTVSTHRARILNKMNMKNNAELVRYALQNDLI
jgi:two-component system, NarL family, invasion response regulator UvrY